MCASVCWASCPAICPDRVLICSVRVVRTLSRARVMQALAWPSLADGAAGCSGQAGVQDGGVGVAAVAHAGQPGGEAPGTEPVGAVLGVEAGQERQADRGVDLGEQADCAGEGIAQVGAELVRDGDAVADEVLAGAAGAAQRNGRGGVRGQGRQPGPVGAQRVGQDERVEPVVLVPGRPVAATQVLDLVRADHHHRDPRAEQGVDDRAVGALDRGFPGTGAGQDAGQLAQAGCAVLDRVPADLAAAGIHDRHGVIIAGPVDASGHAAGWFFGKGSSGRLQACLLAARPSGEAPSCGAGTRLPVRSLFGARRRSALLTVGAPRVTARPRRTHGGRQERQASRAVAWRHLGCISSLTATDTRMVHQ